MNNESNHKYLWHTIIPCTYTPFTDSTGQQWAPYGHPKRRCGHNLHVQGAFVPRKCRGTHAWTVFPVAKGRTTGAEDDFIKPSHVYVLPSHSYVIGEIFFFFLADPLHAAFFIKPSHKCVIDALTFFFFWLTPCMRPAV